MTVSRLIARPMLASTFFIGGVNALRHAPALGAQAGPVAEKVVPRLRQVAPSVPIPSDPVTLVRINAVAQLAAAAALATGRTPRLAATVLAASLVPTTLAGHSFWQYTDKEERKQQQLQFFKNLSMLGGLVIAAGDTEGKPGVAWRARRAARDARREAGYLAGTARREVKLAKAQLG
jgi:putative oxidoreductase